MTNEKPITLEDGDLDFSGAGPVDTGEDGPKIITRHGEVDALSVLSAIRAQVGASSDKSPTSIQNISEQVFEDFGL